jgi:PAS domain S-box-containing protein/TyrR family helix-turn-helix protein
MEQFELAARELESYKNLNRQLNTIIESSSDGIWVCDGQANVISVNTASEKLNNVKAADIIGRNIVDIMKDGLFEWSATLEALRTRRQVSVVQYIRNSGNTLLVTGTPVFDEAGKIFMVVVNERDMTQLNAISEQLEQTRMVTEKYRDEIANLTALESKKEVIVSENSSMKQVLQAVLRLAGLDGSGVLLLGESGTGKGLLAKFMHRNGRRSGKPFIQINCAALPENLLEAELFGYEKGAFTGALQGGKAGLFELAHGGTLFLDEIGDLPPSLQSKLLKYLDDFEVMRLGGLKPKKIDCALIAATNRDLESLASSGQFRRDLLYRLNTFTIRIPPLRARKEDIFELIHHFLRQINDEYGLDKRVSANALIPLQSYSFPGNVRELKSMVKRAAFMSDKAVIENLIMDNFGVHSADVNGIKRDETGRKCLPGGVAEIERELIQKALSHCKSTRELAKYLGVSQPTVVRRLKKYGITCRPMR